MNARLLLPLALLSLVVAACGGTEDASTPAGTTAPAAPSASTAAPAADTKLEIELFDDASQATSEHKTIDCADAAMAEVCANLAAAESDPFAAPPVDQACTEIFGGPGKAIISGTFKGAAVSTTVTRGNGCEIARWDRLVELGVIPAGVGGVRSS